MLSSIYDGEDDWRMCFCLRGWKERNKEITLGYGENGEGEKRKRKSTREREREGEPRGSELSRAISLAERSSFGSANARVPRRNRKLRLGFHLRCCAADRVAALAEFAVVRKRRGARRRRDATRLDSTGCIAATKSRRLIKVATAPPPKPFPLVIITTTRQAGSATSKISRCLL